MELLRAPTLLTTALLSAGLLQACSRPTLVGPAPSSNAAATVEALPTATPALSYSPSNANYMQGFLISENAPVISRNVTVTSYQVTPPLPDGLVLDPSTGVISGTPTTVTAAAAYSVQASVGTGETITAQITLAVGSSTPDPTRCDMMISPQNIAYGGTGVLSVTLRNADGDRIPDSGLAARLTLQMLSTGTSAVTMSTFQPAGNAGIYQATLTGVTSGTQNKLRISFSTTVLTQEPGFKVLPGPPGKVTVELGDAQIGTVGAALPTQLVAKVTDIRNVPVSGVSITWTILTGAGTLASATSISNDSGLAKITWTLGTAVGAQSLRAGVGTALPATFTATAISDALSKFVITGSPANADAGVAFSFNVTAVDRFGNTVTNYTGPVHFTTSDPFSATLPADTTFTLADAGTRSFNATLTTTGIQTVTASAGPVTGKSTNIFVKPAGASQLVIITGPASATAGQTLGAILIRAVDPYGNTATSFNNPVTLAIENNAGGGTLSGTKTVSAVSGSVTLPGLSIGKAGHGYTLKATAGSLSPVTSAGFDISPGTASALVAVSGAGQTAADTTTLPLPFTARAQDSFGNWVPGAKIAWYVATGGGSTTPTLTTTDSDGLASSTLTLGSNLGSQSVQATLQSTSVSITFSATAVPGPPASVAVVSGNNQIGIAGTVMGIPLLVVVKDAGGNLLSNIQIDWAFTTTPVGNFSVLSGMTDITGKHSTFLTLSPKAGTNTITATAHGTPIAATFTATGNPSTLSWQFGGTQFASGRCLPISLNAMDPSGSLANVSINTNVTLATTGSGAFFSDSNCTTASVITSTAIAIGTNSKALYYRDRAAENTTVTATDTSGPLTAANTVIAWGPARIAWKGPSVSVAGYCLGFTLSLFDDLGKTVPALGTLTAQLASTGTGAGSFYTTSACTISTTTVTFSGTGTAAIYYKGTGLGTPTLTITDPSATVAPGKINLALISINQYGQTGGGIGNTGSPVITHDSNGNVFVASTALGNFVSGYGLGAGGQDLYLAKFDSTGANVWSVQKGPTVPGQGWNIAVYGIAADSSGNVYVSATSNLNLATYSGYDNTAGAWNLYVIKFNSSGVQQWASKISLPAKTTQASQLSGNLSIDSSGNLLVTGYTAGDYAAGTGAAPSGAFDALLVKLNSSGTILWAKQLGSTGQNTLGASTVFDSAGNAYMSGITRGNLITGSGTSVSTTGNDAFIAKFDSSGVFQWVKQYGYPASNSFGNALAADASGNVYFSGGSALNMATESGQSQGGTMSAFVIKYDSTGAKKWVQHIKSGGGYGIQNYGLTIDSNGVLYATGPAYRQLGMLAGEVNATGPANASGRIEAYLARFDSSGTALGVTQRGSTLQYAIGNTTGFGVTVTPAGTIFLATITGADLANVGYLSKGQQDLAILKFDSSAVYQSVNQIGSTYSGLGTRGLAFDSSSNAYVVGETQMTISTGQFSIGSPDGFIIKFDSFGTKLWSAQIGQQAGSTYARAVAVDPSGNVLVAGSTSANFAAGTGLTTAIYESFIAKYDSSGTQLWIKQTSTAAGKTVNTYGLAVDASGNSYVVGFTNANVIGLVGYPKSPNSYDGYLIKYDPAGTVLWTKQIGYATTNRIVQAFGVAIDTGGNPIITGETNTNFTTSALQTSRSVFAIKYNSAGVQQWIYQTPDALSASSGSAGSGGLIATDASNNIFVAGFTGTNLVAGSGPAFGANDYFVMMLDSSGAKKWLKQKGSNVLGSGAQTIPSAIVTDSAGSVYITGRVNGDLAANAFYFGGNYDAFFSKYDKDGNEQWTRQFVRAQIFSNAAAIEPTTGNICFAGYANILLTSQGGAAIGQNDSWLAKFPP